LESKTVLSAGGAMAPVAPAVARHAHAAALVAPQSDARISLGGTADGYYSSTESSHGAETHYHLTAGGTITPIGEAIVKGHFHVRDGKDSGTLKIVGSDGTLRLKLTTSRPIIAGTSTSLPPGFNPGGPMQPASTSTSGGPVILVNDFSYTITGGTGQYAHDQGAGAVAIATTPGTTPPPGTGFYASTLSFDTGFGQTTVTFEPVPLI
jgi:hypothetical protein